MLGGALAFGSAGLFGTSLIEVGDGAGIRAIDPVNGIQGDIFILPGGGTIDVRASSTISGASISAARTKAGTGLLLLEDGNDASTGDGGINVLAGTLALGTAMPPAPAISASPRARRSPMPPASAAR